VERYRLASSDHPQAPPALPALGWAVCLARRRVPLLTHIEITGRVRKRKALSGLGQNSADASRPRRDRLGLRPALTGEHIAAADELTELVGCSKRKSAPHLELQGV
jgi:hypothetical protein